MHRVWILKMEASGSTETRVALHLSEMHYCSRLESSVFNGKEKILKASSNTDFSLT